MSNIFSSTECNSASELLPVALLALNLFFSVGTLRHLLVYLSARKTLCDFPKAYKEGDRFFLFPGDGDGKLHLVDALAPINTTFRDEVNLDESSSYWLYTRNNPSTPQFLRINDVNSVSVSHFSGTKQTVFLVHGWFGNGENRMNKLLTTAFLQNGDFNVIVLDWSAVARLNYVTAKQQVPVIGQLLGQFINWLTTIGTPFNQIHVVGFSLGAHLVGAAGRETNGQIRRITGLDPAGPLWRGDMNRLQKSDGRYVEIIHTSAGNYGYRGVMGDADYFPNEAP